MTAVERRPIYVEQVANVQIGNALPGASLVKGTQEAVGGVVVARTGVNTKDVIDAVKARIAQIAAGPAAGRHIVPFYDRADLIEQAVGTLRTALIEEIVLVTLAHVIFLMHFRSILIVTLPLPLAVLMSFLVMYYAGISSNIMSLAGIAIAIGVLVDAGIVVTENAFRLVEQHCRGASAANIARKCRDSRIHAVGRPAGVLLDGDHPARLRSGVRADRSGRQVVSSARLHQDVCGARGDGHRRHARSGALHVAVRGRFHPEEANPVMRVLRAVYRPALRSALAHRALTISAAAALFAFSVYLATAIGTEFMPPLNEGDLMFMPIADPSISLTRPRIDAATGRDHRAMIPKWTPSSARSRGPTRRPIRRRST